MVADYMCIMPNLRLVFRSLFRLIPSPVNGYVAGKVHWICRNHAVIAFFPVISPLSNQSLIHCSCLQLKQCSSEENKNRHITFAELLVILYKLGPLAKLGAGPIICKLEA